jgi:hypothetical protein
MNNTKMHAYGCLCTTAYRDGRVPLLPELHYAISCLRIVSIILGRITDMLSEQKQRHEMHARLTRKRGMQEIT